MIKIIAKTLLMVVGIVVMSAFVSCGLPQKARSLIPIKAGSEHRRLSKIEPDRLSPDRRMRFNLAYTEALCQQEKGNYAEAYELLRYCLAIDTASAAVHNALSFYMASMGQDSMAVIYTKKAMQLSPDNDAYIERYGISLIGKEQYAEASKIYEKLADNDRSRSDVLEVLQQLYTAIGDYDGILRTLDRMEQIEGSSEDITFAKMHVYSQQGKKDLELAELRKMADKHPYDMNYRVMIGNWLLSNNQKQEAFDEYMSVVKKEPENLAVQLSLIDYYQEERQDSVVRQMSRNLLFNSKCDMETRKQLLRQMISNSEQQHRDSTEMLQIIDSLIRQEPMEVDFAIVKMAYMTVKQMPQDSIDNACRYVLKVKPENSSSRFSLVRSMWDKSDFDEVIALCQQGNDYNPDDMSFYYFLGMAYFQKDDVDKSLDAFQRGVSQINSESDPVIVSDFYAMMGDLLHLKGQNKKAFEAYDSCLQWRPENYGALNNYAYYLTITGQDLERAETMSRKTVEAEPTNATFLDTYAWVLFNLGRYDEAKEYIDRMLQQDEPHSSVVLHHAGDIYAKNGLMEEAVGLWKRALEQDRDNTLLQEKIKKQRYIEL